MEPINAPHFFLDECRDTEREFVLALHARAEAGNWFADAWRVWKDRLTLSVCVGDRTPGFSVILRTLRIDFDGSTVRFGPDETHQFASDLDPERAGVSVLSGVPVAELVTAAADWLEREMRRPVVRHEWSGPGFQRCEWVLSDTGQGLVARDSENRGRRDDLGPPHRVVKVWGS